MEQANFETQYLFNSVLDM